MINKKFCGNSAAAGGVASWKCGTWGCETSFK